MKWQSKQTQTQQDSGALANLLKEFATYVKAKVTGFYCLNGESVIEFPESNRAEDFIAFLRVDLKSSW